MAQSNQINGFITNENNEIINGATIVLYDLNKNIIDYAITDQKGYYLISSKIETGYFLEVSYLGYEKKTVNLSINDTNKDIISLDITLTEETNHLDEVVLLLRKEEKDTVNFDLQKLNLQDNDKLKEILEKLPNLQVGEDGVIIYKGNNINKILVNKKETFENQNSLALENIENRLIEGLSVINNYQDEFSVDFDLQEETVLNIETKEEFKNVITGDLQTKYGHKDKYELKGSGFLFSESLNAFSTANFNNIGKTVVNYRELGAAFNDKQNFSIYSQRSLQSLFSTNENLRKDEYNSINLTLKKNSSKFKSSLLLYYISPNRINSSTQQLSSLDGTPLLQGNSSLQAKSSSYLGYFKSQYKKSKNTVFSLEGNLNLINADNRNTEKNTLYSNDQTIENNLFSTYNSKIFSGFAQLGVTSKLSDKLLWNAEGSFFMERNKLDDDIFLNEDLYQTQYFDFSKYNYDIQSTLSYNYNDQFTPSIRIAYNGEKSQLDNDDLQSISRTINTTDIITKITGKNLLGKINYFLSGGVRLNQFELDNSKSIEEFLIPLNIFSEYERDVWRIAASVKRSFEFNDLYYGLTTIQPFNRLVQGNSGLLENLQTKNNYQIGYYYNNIFDAESYSISTSYSDTKNPIELQFISQDNGVSTLKAYKTDYTRKFNINGKYAKTLFPIDFPLNTSIGLSYLKQTFPAIIADGQEVLSKQNAISPKFEIESLIDFILNVRLSSNLKYSDNVLGNNNYHSRYTRSIASLLLKNDHWDGKLSFIYDDNLVNDQKFQRKNINLDLSYSWKKFTFSLESRHLFELLDIFQNEAYNFEIYSNEGVVSTIINDASLNYLILGLKYNF
ncbi:MAG: carboxypeptidase-like regulatory domain-containing protein [Zunongwangia sp.]|uniref:carboxypeptidase-like regulatory domain-containing protein n=1 Tax=Zunongwangia sp. TaxID=1965325 RepID=UPI003242CEA0